MCVGEPVQVVLRIHQTENTISGQVVVEGAVASDFYGWLELIDHLERASARSDKGHRVARGGEVTRAGTSFARREFT
jgi:hypothetical protein